MSGLFKRPARSCREDDEWVTRLYRETRQDLLAFLLRRCATAEDAADCLAETYRIAWEKRTDIPAEGQARPWLFGVARNVAKRERARDHERAAATQQLALAADSAAPPATARDRAVTVALSQLSPLDRDIVLMLSVGGLTPREVASVLALSPNAVRVRAHRARDKLRTLLAQHDADDDAEPRPTEKLSSLAPVPPIRDCHWAVRP